MNSIRAMVGEWNKTNKEINNKGKNKLDQEKDNRYPIIMFKPPSDK